MKLIYKNIGETPLEALEKFRKSEIALHDETLSYIGRLDPMAEGEMIVLIGREENQNRNKYLHFDKEYLADFLIGFSTDTGDLLGMPKKGKFSDENLFNKIENIPIFLSKITLQKFPWFSSKHVLGKALFDWFKSGRKNEIERPFKKIIIYDVELMNIKKINTREFYKYLMENIKKVKGNFRQDQILIEWKKNFSQMSDDDFFIFSLKIKCSTGTYIRALAEEIEKEFNFPVVLFGLKRTKIFL